MSLAYWITVGEKGTNQKAAVEGGFEMGLVMVGTKLA